MERLLLPALIVLTNLAAHAQVGPVYHWLLDEDAGAVAHEWVGGSHGTLTDGALWDPAGGRHGGAVRFDGVDDRILAGPCDLTNGGTGITLALWVKPDFVTGMDRTILAKAHGPQVNDAIWSITFVNASSIRFRLRTGGTVAELNTGPSSIFNGVWYHVVASYDGAHMRVHVNGALMGSLARSGSIGFHPTAGVSMAALGNGTQPFSGWLDDVRIYDRGLTEMEIIDLLFANVPTHVETASPTPRQAGLLGCPSGAWEQVTVLDATGRVTYEAVTLTGDAPMPLANLPSGMHLLRLRTGDRKCVRKVHIP
ncbi:MAG: hypothetical protein KIT10_04630 [Flavobacteriales bacterium]|nr:hypothetical protein [Flavobacteriales bacterium]